jgi:bifunctional DNA-binding transcriptional regulator/antitoxin component of YhaV-PrlF toxin-antitoxin module
MAMAVVKVRSRGQLTLPASVRKDLRLDDETTMTLVKVGDVILLSPRPLKVDAVAKKAQREMKKAGLSLKDLLADLDRQRDRYARERYGA